MDSKKPTKRKQPSKYNRKKEQTATQEKQARAWTWGFDTLIYYKIG